MKTVFKKLQPDLVGALVLFIVAIPFCIGIALGSNAPLFSGIISGIVGGILVGQLSGSPISVSGPAAGLTAIVATSILQLQSFEAFLLAVVLAGIFQILMGYIKAGILGHYIPNAVIRGVLSAIGLILILKQLPHLVGYDADYAGDETFFQNDSENTFSELANAISSFTPAAIIIGLSSLLIIVLMGKAQEKSDSWLKHVPIPLVLVLYGVVMNAYFKSSGSIAYLQGEHLITLPSADSFNGFLAFINTPDFSRINDPLVWKTAFTIAIIASIETLLSIVAVDKLDPLKRVTPTSRELKAQGLGNIVSGLIGGLPITSVIVRSSANLEAGSKTKNATIFHGILLLLSFFFFAGFLNKIPLASLASILIYIGYKLVSSNKIREVYNNGWSQFAPFAVTIVAILFTDLLQGVSMGIIVALFFMIRSNFRSNIITVNNNHQYLVRLRKDISFLNKPIIKNQLEKLPSNSSVLIDTSRADFIDQDIIEAINEFREHAHLKNIKVEVKKNINNPMQDAL